MTFCTLALEPARSNVIFCVDLSYCILSAEMVIWASFRQVVKPVVFKMSLASASLDTAPRLIIEKSHHGEIRCDFIVEVNFDPGISISVLCREREMKQIRRS